MTRCRFLTRFGNAFKACRNAIHTVAENIVALDQDVTEVDSWIRKSIRRSCGMPALRSGHHRLHGHRAFDGINYLRRKLEQHAVASGLNDPATVICHQRIGDGARCPAKSAGGADLVRSHQAAVASNVRRHNSRQSPLDPIAAQVGPLKDGKSLCRIKPYRGAISPAEMSCLGQKPPFCRVVTTSAKGQQETHAPQQTASLCGLN